MRSDPVAAMRVTAVQEVYSVCDDLMPPPAALKWSAAELHAFFSGAAEELREQRERGELGGAVGR